MFLATINRVCTAEQSTYEVSSPVL